MIRRLALVLLLVGASVAQPPTILPRQRTVNSTTPALDQTHKLAAAAACNNTNVGKGPLIENPALNTYCAHGGTNPVNNATQIWGTTGAATGGPLASCLANVAGTGAGVPNNGCIIVLDAGLTAPLVLTSVAATVSGTAVYTGTITGGASNAFVGYRFVTSGFANASNNGTFYVSASSATSLTLDNPLAVAETATASAAPYIEYDIPGSHVPNFDYVGGLCSQNGYLFGTGCHGLMPPTIQTSANFTGNTPQYIYFISTQYATIPPQGTRVNPSVPLGGINGDGDGFSEPLNLAPNINNDTQMAHISETIDLNGYPILLFGNGPAYYRFDGIEFIPKGGAFGVKNGAYTVTHGFTFSGISTQGEGASGGRPFSVTNNGLARARQDGAIHIVGFNYPWINQCHMDGPNGPDPLSELITGNVNHTIFCDTYSTHMSQGQTMLSWSWNNRTNGDLDVTMPIMAAGGTKYALTTCVAGATSGGDATLGNVCVVDTMNMCDGATPGQCFKVEFNIAQNATLASCTAAFNTTTVGTKDNTAQCYNGGIHTFWMDTIPSSAVGSAIQPPAKCFGPGTATTDGSDCASVWVGGGIWAAGTEHVMTTEAVRIAFDNTLTPSIKMASCQDTTKGIPCEISPIDGVPLIRNYTGTGGQVVDQYTIGFTGYQTNWSTGHIVEFGSLEKAAHTNTVNSTTSITHTAQDVGANSVFPSMIMDYRPVISNNFFSIFPKYQNPTSDVGVLPVAAMSFISAQNPPYYGVDFCSLPVGDGTLGPKYTRNNENQVIKGRSFTIRCWLYANAAQGSTFNATSLACPLSNPTPCPNSFTTSGVDFGSDIVIDSVTLVPGQPTNSFAMDITAFVCDGTTVHGGHGQTNLCTPQVQATEGAVGPQFEHIYLHGMATIIHTGLNGDPGPVGSICNSSVELNPTWQCTSINGQMINQGIHADASFFSLRDSYIDNIWGYQNGIYPDLETVALLTSSGPTEIANNFLSGASETIFSGGSGGPFGNSDASNTFDLLAQGNYMFRGRWMFNLGVGLPNKSTNLGGWPKAVTEVKNFQEQKTGSRWEWTGNIGDLNFWGLVTPYSTINLTPRSSNLGNTNICCQFLTDVYFHDNLTINSNQLVSLFGLDTFCELGSKNDACGRGVFEPNSAHRFLLYNGLYLQNQTSTTTGSQNNPPTQLLVGAAPNHFAVDHVTFAFQDPLASSLQSGLLLTLFQSDYTPSCPPNGGSGGPVGQLSGVHNFWLLNTVFGSSPEVVGGCSLQNIFQNPIAVGSNDMNHRFAGTIYPRGSSTQNITAVLPGLNTTPATYCAINYANPTNGAPNPFVTFANSIPYTYQLDTSIGFAGDYTLKGNQTNGVIPTQVLGGWTGVGGNCVSGFNTTDGLVAGVLMPRLLAAVAQTPTGVPGSTTPTITSVSPLATGAVGETYSTTLSCVGGTPPYTWSYNSGSYASGLSLAPSTGVVSGTPTSAGTQSPSLICTDSLTNASAPATLSIPVNPRLAVNTQSLPNGLVNTPYNQTLQSTGGIGPFTWSRTSGSLPIGLTLGTNGSITGTPTTAGLSSFTAQVCDAQLCASQSLSIRILPPSLTITTLGPSLPSGTVGVQYSTMLSATGGTLPYTWSVISGTLPAGLGLNAPTGTISGTPTTANASTFAVKVTDSTTPTPLNAQATFTIDIQASTLAITTTSLSSGVLGAPYQSSLAATGGSPPYSWSLCSGVLPTGLNFSGQTIGGTPLQLGVFPVVLRVTDQNSVSTCSTSTMNIVIVQGTGTVLGGGNVIMGTVVK